MTDFMFGFASAIVIIITLIFISVMIYYSWRDIKAQKEKDNTSKVIKLMYCIGTIKNHFENPKEYDDYDFEMKCIVRELSNNKLLSFKLPNSFQKMNSKGIIKGRDDCEM